MAIDDRAEIGTSLLTAWYKQTRTGTESKFEYNLVKHHDKVLKSNINDQSKMDPTRAQETVLAASYTKTVSTTPKPTNL